MQGNPFISSDTVYFSGASVSFCTITNAMLSCVKLPINGATHAALFKAITLVRCCRDNNEPHETN